MKSKFSLFCLCSLLFISCFSQTMCGAWIMAPSQRTAVDFRSSVGDQLHITHQRDQVVLDDDRLPNLLDSKFQLVLNINAGTPYLTGSQSFVKDTTTYKKKLQNRLIEICKKGKPALLVPDNEEANLKYHYGPAKDYINQLQAAIQISHSFGIPITNAGLTMPGLCYLVYKNMIARGLNGDAQRYASAVGLAPNSARTIERGGFTDTLLTAYAKMDLDKINFHWYQRNSDTWALGKTMDYLILRSGGIGIISNETGQYDSDPKTVTYTVNEFRKHNSTLLIWFSGDGGPGKAIALQNDDKTIRPNGIAYRDAQGW